MQSSSSWQFHSHNQYPPEPSYYHVALVRVPGKHQFGLYFVPDNLTDPGKLIGWDHETGTFWSRPQEGDWAHPWTDRHTERGYYADVLVQWNGAAKAEDVSESPVHPGLDSEEPRPADWNTSDFTSWLSHIVGHQAKTDVYLEALYQAYLDTPEDTPFVRNRTSYQVTLNWLDRLRRGRHHGPGRPFSPVLTKEQAERGQEELRRCLAHGPNRRPGQAFQSAHTRRL